MISPLLEGPVVTFAQLEAVFGPCYGAVMGYGEGELASDGRLQWCAAVLPGQNMAHNLNRRAKELAQMGGDIRRPFLIAMGTLKSAEQRGGVPEALYGVALAAPANRLAEELLHSHHLARPENIEKGKFRWPTGVPLLRVWLSSPAVPFRSLIGDHRRFRSSDGIRIVPLDELIPGLHSVLGPVCFREAVLDRPKPLPDKLGEMERKWREGHLRARKGLAPVRDPAAVNAALARNLERFGSYRCEDCSYEPGKDPRVYRGGERGMLDVHHADGLAAGERDTTLADLVVLCPLCHRREHVNSRPSHVALEATPVAEPLLAPSAIGNGQLSSS